MDHMDAMRVWLIIALVICPCLQFSIRRRSIASFRHENPHDLHKALTALDRQRRRNEEAEYFSQGELNNDDTFMPVKKRVPMLADNSYSDMNNDPEIYIPVRESELSELLSAFEDRYRNEAKIIPANEGPHRTAQSLYELQRTLPEDDGENESDAAEVSIEQLNSETGRKEDTTSDSDFVEHTFADETDTENKEQLDTLLEAADELEQENINDLNKEPEIDTTQEVSKQELETVFANNDNSEEAEPILESNGMKRSRGDFNERDNTFDSRYKALNQFIENSKIKKHRMWKRDETSGVVPSNDELLAEIIRLNNEMEKMKLTQTMEDKENDYLASALKGATLSQIEGSDAFLKGEFDDIQNAIKLEELLQIAQIDDDDENGLIDEDGNVYDEQPKRGESPPAVVHPDDEELTHKNKVIPPSLEDSLGRWYDQPVVDEVDGGAFIKPPLYDDNEALMLENFAKQYSPQLKRNIHDVSVPVTEEALFDEGLKQVNHIVTGMTPEERTDLRYQIESILTYQDEAEPCKAASILSSDCRFADLLQLPIDEEARSLCNRHEICYICAETIGMTVVQCDAGYRGDAMEICGEDEQCDEDASLFLGLMQEKHRYTPYQTEFCLTPCIRDYIVRL